MATIKSLVAENEALREQLAALHTLHDGACVRIAQLEAAGRKAPSVKPAYTPRPVDPTEQRRRDAYRAALNAARDLAMRTGVAVRVGD
jgi:hypothetical protein